MSIIKTDIYMWSPDDKIDEECIKFINGAQVSLRIADYSFNLSTAVDAIIARHQAGVDVKLVLDHSQALGSTEIPQLGRLKAAGVPFVEGTSMDHQIMHDKLMIKDSRVTWWGSWNITKTASKQNNTVQIVSDPEIAEKFIEKWQAMWDWITANEPQYQSSQP
jgi:phosphatidylserine/phosphatidylglycerophosphate/cardiolipin synthase-like enzyme